MSAEGTTTNAGKKSRVAMREQAPLVRAKNFEEVPFGYSEEEAIQEAKRCLKCKKPLCVDGCPVNVKIPEFVGLIADGKFAEAARKLKETNALPAVCGRVCPQEEQCESRCVLGKKGESVAIGRLERWLGDFDLACELEHRCIPEVGPDSGKRVAVVGSGPAGLACAGELRRFGHAVTVFESLHATGGVLTYGIPEFRLPKQIVQ